MKQPFSIVFDDEYLVVVDKIAKLLVQPSPKKEIHTLTSLLAKHLNCRVFPCHRLDRQTTGLVIYARTKDMQDKMFKQFKDRQVKKKYYALVKGRMNKKKGKISGKIIDREGRQFGEKARPAETFYRVVSVYPDFSFVELQPFTGRTNQLRIQLSQTGNPILGERKYARGKDFSLNFRRLALHAFYLEFRHPLSNDRLEIKIDMPGDMKEFLKKYAQKR